MKATIPCIRGRVAAPLSFDGASRRGAPSLDGWPRLYLSTAPAVGVPHPCGVCKGGVFSSQPHSFGKTTLRCSLPSPILDGWPCLCLSTAPAVGVPHPCGVCKGGVFS